MKVKAIAFSDLHIHKFRAFAKNPSDRLDWSFKALGYIAELAIDYGYIPVLFMGDLFHNPKEVENEVITKAIRFFKTIFDKQNIHMYGISGNHDMDKENFLYDNVAKLPYSYLEAFEVFDSFHSMDLNKETVGKLNLYGIPYFTKESDFLYCVKHSKSFQDKMKLNILMCHQDFPGCQTPEGMVLNKKTWPNDIFKGWDVVLSGHIHKPQPMWDSKWNKGRMIGSMIHQTAGDIGIDMGYWLIGEDGETRFKIMPNEFPRFKRLGIGESMPINSKDYWLEARDELVEQENEDIVDGFNIKNKSRKELALRYLKEKGIKSKDKKRALIQILNNIE